MFASVPSQYWQYALNSCLSKFHNSLFHSFLCKKNNTHKFTSLSGALDKKEQFLQPTCYCTNLRNGTESVQYGILLCYGKKSDVIVGSCCLSILLRTFPSNGKNAY